MQPNVPVAILWRDILSVVSARCLFPPGMENTLEEYRDWAGGEVDRDTQHAYDKAREKLKSLEPYEDALVGC